MKRPSKSRRSRADSEFSGSQRRDATNRVSPLPRVDPKVEKRLLAVHAAMETDALIRAVFRLLAAAVRCRFVNVCLRCSGPGETRLMLDSLGRRYDAGYLKRFFEYHPGLSL